MIVLHIQNKQKALKIDQLIEKGYDVFILVYMVGCGPCNATRPEWAKLKGVLQNRYKNNDKLAVIDVDKDLLPFIKHIGPVDGFPTMKYIGDHGKIMENYEKDRSVDSFVNWIEGKINTVISTEHTSSAQVVYERVKKTQKRVFNHHNKTRHHKSNYHKSKHNRPGHKHKRNQRGGKWSQKYKNSINCSRPKGFSQKQYCKYGRRK